MALSFLNNRNSLVQKQNQVLTPVQQSVATTQLNERPLNNITTNKNYAQDLATGQNNAQVNKQLAAVMETPRTPENSATQQQLINNLQAQKQPTIAKQEAIASQTQRIASTPTPTVAATGLNFSSTPRTYSLSTNTSPTTTNPMVRVDPRGANSQFAPGAEIKSDSQFTSITPEQYLTLSDSDKQAYNQSAFNQNAQKQVEALSSLYSAPENLYDQRLQDIKAEMDAAKVAKDPLQDEQTKQQLEALDLQKKQAIEQMTAAQGREAESIKESLAFSGFGRSTKAADLLAQSAQGLQSNLADIENKYAGAAASIRTALVEKQDKELERLQARYDQTLNQSDAVKLEKAKAGYSLMTDLMKADPSNPENMIKTAEKLQSTRIEEAKLAQAEQKALRDDARSNFQFMVSNFGSQYFRNLDDESASILASNLGMPASALKNMSATIKEQENQWDRLKYYDSQDFEMNKMQMQNSYQNQRDLVNFDRDLAKINQNLQNDLYKEGIKSEMEAQKDQKKAQGLLNSLGITYSKYAIGGDKRSLDFGGNAPHPSAGVPVQEMNPVIASAYPDGYRFKSSGNDLLGQCKWFAQQLTMFPDGSSWRAGSTLADTKSSFEKYRQAGKAFKVGEAEVRPGMSVLSSDSKTYGHGYVINSITPDGKWVVTESNYKGPLTVSNNRIVDPNDPKVIGVLNTIPKPQYQIPVNKIGNALGAALMNNSATKGVAGLANAFVQGAKQMTPQNIAAEQQRRDEQSRVLTPEQIQAISGLDSDSKKLIMQQSPEVYAQYIKQGGGAKTPEIARLPADKVVLLEDAKFLPGMLDSLENTIKNSGASFDPISGATRGLNPWDTQQQTADAELRRAAQTIGKYMEGGVLRKEDEEKYRRMLPSATDTQDVALNKLRDVRAMLQSKTQGYISGFGGAGYDVSQYQNTMPAMNLTSSTVRVQAPDGNVYEIDQSDLQTALAEGAKQL